MGEALQFRAVHHTSPTADVDQAILSAHQGAERAGASVAVVTYPDGLEIARVWPNGQVDLTWLGCRYL
jgi:hypothetical protein